MPQARYYAPQLDRELISLLYHAVKAQRIPMTRLASSLVREGLMRLGSGDGGESCVVRELLLKTSLYFGQVVLQTRCTFGTIEPRSLSRAGLLR